MGLIDVGAMADLKTLTLSTLTDRAAIYRRTAREGETIKQKNPTAVAGMSSVPCQVISAKAAPGTLRNPLLANWASQSGFNIENGRFIELPTHVGAVAVDVQKGDQLVVTRDNAPVGTYEVRDLARDDTLLISLMLNCEKVD